MKRRRSSSSSSSSTIDTCLAADGQAEPFSRHAAPASLIREVTPPPVRNKSKLTNNPKSTTAKVESGEAIISDHATFFATKLFAARLPTPPNHPHLSHANWLDLYSRNQHRGGHHFVVHQHDHPISGLHYDLRLQINATSSISFAVMYGLPGDPNSRRLNRNATETRVHNLWNHLIETASSETGSMLIWDTGEYEVLPYTIAEQGGNAARSSSESELDTIQQSPFMSLNQSSRLAYSFSRRKIRLRLYGTRLPPGYTISLRLAKENHRFEQPAPPTFRRQGKSGLKAADGNGSKGKCKRQQIPSSSNSSTDSKSPNPNIPPRQTLSSLQATASPPLSPPPAPSQESDSIIRATNAYTGATNTIGSIYQRKWYLSLDRAACGFEQTRKPPVGHHMQTYWVRPRKPEQVHSEEERGKWNEKKSGRSGFTPFYVLGRSNETSIVTGRLAKDVQLDEGVEGYTPRAGWRAVVE